MRILFVASRNIKHRGARYYDPAAKIYNGLVRNGHNVYWLSDRDIARSATPLGIKSLGTKYCNQFYLDVCKNFNPEFVLFCHADIIDAETIAESRKFLPGVKMAQFNVDPIYRPHNQNMINAKTEVLDGTFITTAGPALKQFSTKTCFTSFIPNPVDSSIDTPRCHERDDQEFDVFWAARPAKTYEGDPRYEYPQFLQKQKDIKMQYFGISGKPILYNAQYYEELSNCKMGLSISADCDVGITGKAKPEELYLYSSDRISHYMGSGLLAIITRGFSLEEFFLEDKEAVYCDSKEEMHEKVLFYKKNDNLRKSIAAAGYEKSHKLLNERLATKYIIEATHEIKFSEDYAWPTEKH